jgi:CRP-like cAMP-binding protein
MATLGAPHGNRLLNALAPRDRALISPHLVPTALKVRDSFELPNKPIAEVFFPVTGIASVVAEHPGGRRIEIGIVGCEGVTGSAVVLGSDRTPHHTYMQVAGEGHRLAVPKLRELMAKSPGLQGVLLKYVQAFMVQTAHTAIANARATLTERLARWLLMAHDRVPGDDLALTHEFLSLMLAVRRAGVTEALKSLESVGLIQAARGQITVLNRKAIEKYAGAYYGVPEAEYRRLIRRTVRQRTQVFLSNVARRGNLEAAFSAAARRKAPGV